MNNLEELFIASAELAAELLQHMADNEIDSDYFAVVTDSPNCGREVQSEHSVTEVALMAAGIIEQLIAQLEAKNIRADACVNAFEGIETERFAGKSIGEFLAGEVILNKAEPKPDGSFGFTFSGLAIQIMAESFADQFKSSGAVNYLELLFDHSEVGPLTVTMQRVDGLTPAQKLATAEAALSAAQLDATRWRALLSSPAIRILGHAGLQDDKPIDGHYCHFGMEVWSHYEPYYDNKKAGELITRYADNMIAASLVEGNADAE